MSNIKVDNISSRTPSTTPVAISSDINFDSGKVLKINNSTVLTATQVHGKGMPSGNIVGHNDEQTLYSKNLAGFTLSGDMTVNAAVDIDLVGNNASALSFDSADKAGILELVTTTGSEKVKMSGGLEITGDLIVNGTTTNINSTNLVIEDKNIVLADVTTPTNTTADGAGLTIKGATDKTFNWVNATSAWTSSEDLNLVSGKSYEINGTVVLSADEVLGAITRKTNALAVDGTVSVSTLFGSQVSGSYRFFDINDPRISGTVFIKHNSGSEPDVRVDSNSGTVSITADTASKLNVYISSNVVTFQNKTAASIGLRVYREI